MSHGEPEVGDRQLLQTVVAFGRLSKLDSESSDSSVSGEKAGEFMTSAIAITSSPAAKSGEPESITTPAASMPGTIG